MRVYLGGAFMSEQHENSFLQTEPHFDNGFGINGVSAWIPFHKVTETSDCVTLMMTMVWKALIKGTN